MKFSSVNRRACRHLCLAYPMSYGERYLPLPYTCTCLHNACQQVNWSTRRLYFFCTRFNQQIDQRRQHKRREIVNSAVGKHPGQ